MLILEKFDEYTKVEVLRELKHSYKKINELKEDQKNFRKLSKAVEQSPVSVLITDYKGNIEYVNPKFSIVTGYTLEEVFGKNPRIFSSGRTSLSEYKNLWDTITSGGEWIGEFLNKRKNGDLFWENASISPIKNESGSTTHFVAIKEDITQRKIIEAELKEAKSKAEEMNKIKSIFLANMSHELRTPLTGVMGFASLLSDELTDPYLKEMANIILQSTMRLTETVNSILDLSKIEAEKLTLKISRVNLAEVVKNIADQFKQTAKEKNIFLDIVVRNDNSIAELDKSLVVQIIKNLIQNAVKFTSKGGVAVEIERIKINLKSFVEVRVVDTGIGIDQKNFAKIFEPFRQVSEGLNRGYEGPGLGLTITKKYVELLHGEIFVESNIKLGSKFIVRFPTVVERKLLGKKNIEPENPLDISKGANESASSNLLIVEDDELNRSTIEHYLKNFYNFESVSSGESAVKVVKKKKYDIILMDIALKGMSGLEAAQLIKKVPGNQNIPIVAVTAYAMIGDKERLLKGGCTHYLAKPFTQTSLLSLIKSILK